MTALAFPCNLFIFSSLERDSFQQRGSLLRVSDCRILIWIMVEMNSLRWNSSMPIVTVPEAAEFRGATVFEETGAHSVSANKTQINKHVINRTQPTTASISTCLQLAQSFCLMRTCAKGLTSFQTCYDQSLNGLQPVYITATNLLCIVHRVHTCRLGTPLHKKHESIVHVSGWGRNIWTDFSFSQWRCTVSGIASILIAMFKKDCREQCCSANDFLPFEMICSTHVMHHTLPASMLPAVRGTLSSYSFHSACLLIAWHQALMQVGNKMLGTWLWWCAEKQRK